MSWRLRIWNWIRWMWMGCASSVRLISSQTSRAPTRGPSVIHRPWFIWSRAEAGMGGLVPSRRPFHLELLSRTSMGPPSPSTSTRARRRLTVGLTPEGMVPVLGLARRTIAGGWLAPPRSGAPVAGVYVLSVDVDGWLTRIGRANG